MTLDPTEVTPVTEAIENAAAQLGLVVDDVSKHAEHMVSYWTRGGNHQPQAAQHVANVAALNIACLKGSAALWSVFVDNLVLVRAEPTIHWASRVLEFPRTPRGSQRWRLEVTSIEAESQVTLAATAATLLDGQDRPQPLIDVDRAWPGLFRILVAKAWYVPGLVRARIRAIDVDQPDRVRADEEIMASLTVDASPLVR